MNERDKELALQAGDYVNKVYTPPVRSKTPGKIWEDGHVGWHAQFNAKFADLIRADERAVWERRVARLQSLMDVRESQPNKPCCLAEREACALICDGHADDPVYCGTAIRARGNK